MLSIENKLQIIKLLGKKLLTVIADKYGFGKSTISDIFKEESGEDTCLQERNGRYGAWNILFEKQVLFHFSYPNFSLIRTLVSIWLTTGVRISEVALYLGTNVCMYTNHHSNINHHTCTYISIYELHYSVITYVYACTVYTVCTYVYIHIGKMGICMTERPFWSVCYIKNVKVCMFIPCI